MTSAADGPFRSLLETFRRDHDTPALGGAVLTADGRLDVDVVGTRKRGGDDPARLEDAWHIGSCGKSFTAALYARLVEAGDAAWAAPLSDLFPDLASRIDPGWGGITIDDVLVHRSGLPANLGRSRMRSGFADERPLPDQRSEAVAEALARPPRRPGRFRYSNLGYVLAGAAIDRIAGVPFETALSRHVLAPLGMGSAGFGPPRGLWGHGGRILALGPLGMVDLGGGSPADPERPESDNPAVMNPAGRLHVTLEDWARFQRVFLTGGGGFLQAAAVERLLTPPAGPGRGQAMGWAAALGLDDVSLGQQGSNTYWVATALIDGSRSRTAMVVCNRGSARLLKRTPRLAAELLTSGVRRRPS
jgi:CubicO group peptidase (beta-lactamase class C family)